MQENHTFDSYFGRWCTAPTGSSPTCTTGASCCERGPDADGTGAQPIVLDDSANGAFDPDHSRTCETIKMNGGKMDQYVAGNPLCGDARNLAYADAATVQPYWDLAASGALADRWFQPVVGESSSNDMYLMLAQLGFYDNDFEPIAAGASCSVSANKRSFTGVKTLGEALAAGGISWSWYAEGYADSLAAAKSGQCPAAPDACAAGLPAYPCVFDPGDIPSEYFAQFVDDPRYLRDYVAFANDLNGALLPQVAFVKALGFRSEHPGSLVKISDGIKFVEGVVDAVAHSPYAPDTLVLVVYDEGGGFFDHVAPPPPVDTNGYGTRIPALALGPLARAGAVSHVVLEHSSIVKFIEWNWLKGVTGQLGARDAVVNNLGSLIDPALGVPEQ